MKKILLKGILLMGVIGLFASCLGDPKSSQEPQNAYAYIRKQSGNGGSVFAATSAGFFITSDEIRSMTQYRGKVFIMNFKVVTSNEGVDAIDNIPIYQAEYVDIQNRGEALPETDPLVTTGSIKDKKQIPISRLGVEFASPMKEYAEDVWVFSYTCKVRESEKDGRNLIFKAYVAEDKQYLDTGNEEDPEEPLDANKAIVSLCVERISGEEPTGETLVDYTQTVSIDMSMLRAHFIREGAEEGKLCPIQFQYVGAESSGKPKEEPVVIGSLVDGYSNFNMLLTSGY